jgi:hypothetical protein
MVWGTIVNEKTKRLLSRAWPISPPTEDVDCLFPGTVCCIHKFPDNTNMQASNTVYGKSVLLSTNYHIDHSLLKKLVDTSLGRMVVDPNAEDAQAANAEGCSSFLNFQKQRVNVVEFESVIKSCLPRLETEALDEIFIEYVHGYGTWHSTRPATQSCHAGN